MSSRSYRVFSLILAILVLTSICGHAIKEETIQAQAFGTTTMAGKSSGLTFHYPPYAVGPYVEGEYVAFVPWETLKPYLTPEGVKIFGGARPKGDDDGLQ